MNWLLRNLPSWQGRLLTGLAFVGAAVATALAFVQPSATMAAKATALVALIPAFAAWTFTAIAGGNAAHPHDIRLFERIMATLPEDERHFLRGHDFGNDFMLTSLAGVREISHWQGPTFEFLDRAIERKWKVLRSEIGDFRDRMAQTTAPQRGGGQMKTIHTGFGDREDPSPHVRAKIDALNSGATKVTKLIDEFEPFVRRRLIV
jgi:hypothetical protein